MRKTQFGSFCKANCWCSISFVFVFLPHCNWEQQFTNVTWNHLNDEFPAVKWILNISETQHLIPELGFGWFPVVPMVFQGFPIEIPMFPELSIARTACPGANMSMITKATSVGETMAGEFPIWTFESPNIIQKVWQIKCDPYYLKRNMKNGSGVLRR